MTEYVCMNGEYVEKEKVTISVMAHGFLYRTSNFDVVRGKVEKYKKWCKSIYD